MRKETMAVIQPRQDGRCAARLPLRGLEIGTRLRLPVTMWDAHDKRKYTAICKITEIHDEKHWVRCEYQIGTTTLHECYQYLIEEE